MARRMSSRSSRASSGESTNSVRPGRVGLSPSPLRSTRRQRTPPSAAHARASSTQSRAGPWWGIASHVEEDDGRSRRLDAVLGLAEHPEEPCRAELDRALEDTGPDRRPVHRHALAFRHYEPRRRSTGLREPGDDPLQRRHRRHGLLLEERLLPGDLGGLDVGHGRGAPPARAPILLPSRASTSSREAGLWSLHAMASGSSSAAVAPANTAPGASTSPSSASDATPPLGLRLRRPTRRRARRRKAARARCSRRNALPVAHGSHSTRSSTGPPRASSAAASVAPSRSPTTPTRAAPRRARRSRWRPGCPGAIPRPGRGRSSFRPSPRWPRSRPAARPSRSRPTDAPEHAAPATNRPPPDPCWGRGRRPRRRARRRERPARRTAACPVTRSTAGGTPPP